MEEEKRKIAILMTVYNRRETTLRCMGSLAESVFDMHRFGLDIYVAEDGCTDGTPEAIAEKYPSVRIIHGDGNLFWNRGMYKAWETAEAGNYDFYFWLNDDTFIFNDSLARMLRYSEAHLDKAIIVGNTEASDGSGRITYGGRKDITGWNPGVLVTGLDSDQFCQTMNGNMVLIPRAVYDVLGKNDPFYRHALGDIDYGLRASEAGIEVVAVAGTCGICDQHERPVVWMDPSQSFRKRWNNFFSPTGNNPFEFFHFKKRHFGFWPAAYSFITNILHFFFPALWVKRVPRGIVL